MRRRAAVAVLSVGLGLVGYALFSSPSDEERIHAVLDALAEAISFDEPENPLQRTARLDRAFADLFGEDVVVRIPEAGVDTTGRGSLGQIGARTRVGYQSLRLSVAHVSVEAGANSANVALLAKLSGTRGSEVKSDERRAELRFDKVDGDWRIVRVRVSPPATD